jgi:hypothetical protein
MSHACMHYYPTCMESYFACCQPPPSPPPSTILQRPQNTQPCRSYTHKCYGEPQPGSPPLTAPVFGTTLSTLSINNRAAAALTLATCPLLLLILCCCRTCADLAVRLLKDDTKVLAVAADLLVLPDVFRLATALLSAASCCLTSWAGAVRAAPAATPAAAVPPLLTLTFLHTTRQTDTLRMSKRHQGSTQWLVPRPHGWTSRASGALIGTCQSGRSIST